MEDSKKEEAKYHFFDLHPSWERMILPSHVQYQDFHFFYEPSENLKGSCVSQRVMNLPLTNRLTGVPLISM